MLLLLKDFYRCCCSVITSPIIPCGTAPCIGAGRSVTMPASSANPTVGDANIDWLTYHIYAVCRTAPWLWLVVRIRHLPVQSARWKVAGCYFWQTAAACMYYYLVRQKCRCVMLRLVLHCHVVEALLHSCFLPNDTAAKSASRTQWVANQCKH